MKPDADTSCVIYEQGIFYMHHATNEVVHTTTFVIPVVEHWLEQKIALRVHHEESKKKEDKHYFHLTTHSTHFASDIVKEYSDNEGGNSLLFSINGKGSFICIIPQTG